MHVEMCLKKYTNFLFLIINVIVRTVGRGHFNGPTIHVNSRMYTLNDDTLLLKNLVKVMFLYFLYVHV